MLPQRGPVSGCTLTTAPPSGSCSCPAIAADGRMRPPSSEFSSGSPTEHAGSVGTSPTGLPQNAHERLPAVGLADVLLALLEDHRTVGAGHQLWKVGAQLGRLVGEWTVLPGPTLARGGSWPCRLLLPAHRCGRPIKRLPI